MRSRHVLGAIALGAIVVAAISFAIADVAIASAPCAVGGARCAEVAPPLAAIAFAALGALALLVSVAPAVSWIVGVVQSTRHLPHEVEAEVARTAMPKRVAAAEED